MKKIWSHAKLFLFDPEKAADACEAPDAIDRGLRVYGLWVLCSLVYLWLKPFDFPDMNAAFPNPAESGFGFWLKVSLWEPVLAALTVLLTALVVEWMREGWLPLKTAVATFWSALPLILTVAYVKTTMPRWIFGVGMIAWGVPAWWVGKKIAGSTWRKVTAFLLGLNAVSLALLIPEILATVLRSDLLYKATLGASVLWLLVCGGMGLRKLYATSLARAVLAFLFANLVLNLVIAACYMLHWLPMEVLKVLIYF